jgi:hypothetical protein
MAASLLVAIISTTAMGQPYFEIKLLPEPYGGGSVACGVTPDSSGGFRVVGSAYFEDSDNHRAARWRAIDPELPMEVDWLPTLQEGASRAKLELESWDPQLPGPVYVILGHSTEPSGAKRAVVWMDNGQEVSLILLPVLLDHAASDALGGWAITDPKGQTYVTGWGRDPMGSRHAMVWEITDASDDWEVHGLQDLGPGTESICRGAFAPDPTDPEIVVLYGSVIEERGRELPALWQYVGSEWELVVVEQPGPGSDEEGSFVSAIDLGAVGEYECQSMIDEFTRPNPQCDSGEEACTGLFAPLFPADPPCDLETDYWRVRILGDCICTPDEIFKVWGASQKEWLCPYYGSSYVGESLNGQMEEVATLWEIHSDTTVTAHDLNELVVDGPMGGFLRSARGIDHMGRVVGIIRDPGPVGVSHAFIALPMSPADVQTVELPGVRGRFQLRTSTNPFSERVSIRYRLEEGAPVRVSVYDILGREVAQLANGWHEAGHHQRVWDGLRQRGEQMPSGIYWIRVQSGTLRESRAVVMSR